MRRKVKAGLIEADHDACAIVVHYEIEATVLGEAGEAMAAERSVRCGHSGCRHFGSSQQRLTELARAAAQLFFRAGRSAPLRLRWVDLPRGTLPTLAATGAPSRRRRTPR